MFDLLEKAVDSAIASGAKYSDARILNSKSRSINARNGDIEDFNESESIGIGIRALVGSSWGFYSTYDLSSSSLINSGVKDKTPMYISDYHIDTFDGKGLRYTPKDMDGLMDHPKESIMIGDKEVVYDYDKVYNYSLDLMHKMHGVPKVKQGEKPNGKQGLIQEIHDAQWVSNVLKMAESNKIHTPGTDILKEPFHRLKGKTYYRML